MALTLVIDYLSGARRGQRQVLDVDKTVSFGRHPDNMVVFDAQADIDASSRHAELALQGDTYQLRDVGSSNGTWIDNAKIQVHELVLELPLEVEFGKGGPKLRIWLGEDEADAPAKLRRRGGWRRLLRG